VSEDSQPVNTTNPAELRSSGKPVEVPLVEGRNRLWILLGVGGVSFAVIFMEIIFYQVLSIFSDYVTANSVISIALLGGAIGGLIGYFTAHRSPFPAMITANFILPVSILSVLDYLFTPMDNVSSILIVPLLMMAPFICAGVVISIALVRLDSHVTYFVTLIGSGLAAFLVNMSLGSFREENSLIFLAALTSLAACCFIVPYRVGQVRRWMMCLAVLGVLSILAGGILNMTYDWFNIVRTKLTRDNPQAEVLFSRSSYVGRYDVLQSSPYSTMLESYENGHRSDTIRKLPAENYQIDPRLPNCLIENPDILIIGLAGDGITKTAKFLGEKVYGVEINPAIVSLQTNELVEWNANSYEGIDVFVMDGRSYVEQSELQFDMITLENTHFNRGWGTAGTGREPTPEYLYTSKALHSYLDHLTSNGVVVVEEPVSISSREVPVWKLLFTMRQVLLERGYPQPEQHFFVFQWTTETANFIQILMKKTPFTEEEVSELLKWLDDIDNIRTIEQISGSPVGPIHAKTTILHHPYQASSTTVSQVLHGEVDDDFLKEHNIQVITDDRPFMFDVEPSHSNLKKAYSYILYLVLPLVPFLIWFLGRRRGALLGLLPHMFTVALTGLGYLLIEMVLIQRYELFLGSPVATFSSVVGTLLIFSGLGSLWSSRISKKGVYYSLGIIILLLILYQYLAPAFFSLAAQLSLPVKIILAVVSIAPLGFFTGIPFPYVLRSGKVETSGSVVAMLYALNAAFMALAVPLAFNISTNWGLAVTFLIGIFIYGTVWLLLVAIHGGGTRKMINLCVAVFIILLLVSPWLPSIMGQ
jgi:predicted membrane-bound spermidine synthase